MKDPQDRLEMGETFVRNGPVMIILSRAAPMVPEVTACMAGVTAMPYFRYAAFFTLGTLPYALIASYAGSISSLTSPQPAIYATLLLYGVLWTGWLLFRRQAKKRAPC